MSLSECEKCGGHIPLGPNATNCCEKCGEHVMGTPTGFPPALDAAVRERQAAPVARVRIVVPDLIPKITKDQWALTFSQYGHEMYFKRQRDRVLAAIRAAGCVPVNGQGREIE
jgi:hypothetical protein